MAYSTILNSTTTATGYTVATGASSSIQWADTASSVLSVNSSTPSLHVNGSAKFNSNVSIDGDLEVSGRKITDILDNIERRLAILVPNPEIETRWVKLKELGDQYRALEAEIKEKEEIIKILKS